jgi:hypothetical protein
MDSARRKRRRVYVCVRGGGRKGVCVCERERGGGEGESERGGGKETVGREGEVRERMRGVYRVEEEREGVEREGEVEG